MKRVLFALVATLVTGNAAFAQIGYYPRPYTPRPTVSPYLNLFRSGATNYYGVIRPQLETGRALQQLQFQQQWLAQSHAEDVAAPAVMDQSYVGTTGHPVTFFNYGHYFTAPGVRGVVGGTGFGAGFGQAPPPTPIVPVITTGTVRR